MYVIHVLNNDTYLRGYDPYGDPPGATAYRTGKADLVRDSRKAMVFSSYEEAYVYWAQVHPRSPGAPMAGRIAR